MAYTVAGCIGKFFEMLSAKLPATYFTPLRMTGLKKADSKEFPEADIMPPT